MTDIEDLQNYSAQARTSAEEIQATPIGKLVWQWHGHPDQLIADLAKMRNDLRAALNATTDILLDLQLGCYEQYTDEDDARESQPPETAYEMIQRAVRETRQGPFWDMVKDIPTVRVEILDEITRLGEEIGGSDDPDDNPLIRRDDGIKRALTEEEKAARQEELPLDLAPAPKKKRAPRTAKYRPLTPAASRARQLRLEAGDYQSHLAEKIGTVQAYISRMERGDTNLDEDLSELIANSIIEHYAQR